jgi:hypothetical protein
MTMDDEIVEQVNIAEIIGENPEPGDEVRALIERINERIVQDVVALIREGHTLDQIEIRRKPPLLTGNRIRLTYTVIGRRPVAD